MQIIFINIISAHLFETGIALCRLSVLFSCRNDQKDGVSFLAQIHDPGTEVVTQPAGAGTAKLQNVIRGIRMYDTLFNHT